MMASLSRRVPVALLIGGLAFAGPAVTPVSAAVHHGGGGHHGGGMHNGGGWRGHYAGGYYHRHYGYGYGGGYYGGYGYYGPGPGCVPVLGLVTGNFCGY